ncbi:MAG: hypothetical protein IPL88_09385 [Rhizobiales bacterium]|nr:hypothetical protein [Hyphomicrobiales bacterium]
MTDAPHLTPVPNLAEATRRARVDIAEQSQVVEDLRNGEIARLDMLAEAIRPVLAQVPQDVDLFDVGVVPGARPRLFVDVIAYVEMARDRRTYRFLQETRHGRVTVRESDRVDAMTQAIADYVARRLIERDRALASDMTVEDAARALLARESAPAPQTALAGPETNSEPRVETRAEARAEARPARRTRGGFAERALLFLVQFLGAAALTLIVAIGLYMGWRAIMGVAG